MLNRGMQVRPLGYATFGRSTGSHFELFALKIDPILAYVRISEIYQTSIRRYDAKYMAGAAITREMRSRHDTVSSAAMYRAITPVTIASPEKSEMKSPYQYRRKSMNAGMIGSMRTISSEKTMNGK